jgi:3'-5' exonuclease
MRCHDRTTDGAPARLVEDLRKSDRCVTWNGRGFDLPLLSLHALADGLDFSWYESRRHRFPNYKTPLWHYDMQEQLGDYGAVRLGLDRVAKLLGLGKQGMHGADVFEALAQGRREEVLAYCMNDTLITYLIYLRWSQTHGAAKGAAEAFDQTLAWAKSHSVLKEFYK